MGHTSGGDSGARCSRALPQPWPSTLRQSMNSTARRADLRSIVKPAYVQPQSHNGDGKRTSDSHVDHQCGSEDCHACCAEAARANPLASRGVDAVLRPIPRGRASASQVPAEYAAQPRPPRGDVGDQLRRRDLQILADANTDTCSHSCLLQRGGHRHGQRHHPNAKITVVDSPMLNLHNTFSGSIQSVFGSFTGLENQFIQPAPPLQRRLPARSTAARPPRRARARP